MTLDNIDEVQELPDGGYLVNGTHSVPADTANRDNAMVRAWIEAGNTPTGETLAEARARRSRQVDALRDQKLAAGFKHYFDEERGVHNFGTSSEDRDGWDEVKAIADAAIQAGQPTLPIAIRTDTGDTTIQAQEWASIQLTWGAAMQLVWQRSWALKDAIEDAQDVAAVDAIDIEAGW